MSPSSLYSLCFTNLCLLGFVPYHHHLTATTALRPTDPSVSDSFFSGNSSTRIKTTEAALWFLFNKLDPIETQKRLSSCWPILDRNQAREFRNCIFKWLEALKKSGDLPSNVAVRRGYLDECRGERFEQLLASLSSFAVKTVLDREFHPCHSTPTNIPIRSLQKHYPSQVETLLQRHIHLQTESVVQMSYRELQLEDGYKKCAEIISKHWITADVELANVTKARKEFAILTRNHPPSSARNFCIEKESIYDGNFNSMSSQFGTAIGRGDHEQTLNRLHGAKDKQVQRVAEIWENLLEYIRGHHSKIGAIDHVISQQLANNMVLDATKCGVLKVPQALLWMATNGTSNKDSTLVENLQKMQEELYSRNQLSLPTLLSVVRLFFNQLLHVFGKNVSKRERSGNVNPPCESLPLPNSSSGCRNVSTVLMNMRDQNSDLQEIKKALKARLESAEIRIKGRLAEKKTTGQGNAKTLVEAITTNMDLVAPVRPFTVTGLLGSASNSDPESMKKQKKDLEDSKTVHFHEELLASAQRIRTDARLQASLHSGGKSPTHPKLGMNENIKPYARPNACEKIETIAKVRHSVEMHNVVNAMMTDPSTISGTSNTKLGKENNSRGTTSRGSFTVTKKILQPSKEVSRTVGRISAGHHLACATKPSVPFKPTISTNLDTKFDSAISLGSRPVSKPSLTLHSPDVTTDRRKLLATTPQKEQEEQTARPYDILCDQIVDFVNADQTAPSTPQRRGNRKEPQNNNAAHSRNPMLTRGGKKKTRQNTTPLRRSMTRRMVASIPTTNDKAVTRPHRVDSPYELALCDPLSAMETTAFLTRSEIPRTPEHRSNIHASEMNAKIPSSEPQNKGFEAFTSPTVSLVDTTFEIGSPDISMTLPPLPSISIAPTRNSPTAMEAPVCEDKPSDSISCAILNQTMGAYAVPSSPSFSMSFASALHRGDAVDGEFWTEQKSEDDLPFNGCTEEEDEFILNDSLQIELNASAARTACYQPALRGSPVREEGHSILKDLPIFATPGGTRNLDLIDDLFDEGMPEFLSNLDDD